jgi:hypothetical protein
MSDNISTSPKVRDLRTLLGAAGRSVRNLLSSCPVVRKILHEQGVYGEYGGADNAGV